jgi:hypothetical protein
MFHDGLVPVIPKFVDDLYACNQLYLSITFCISENKQGKQESYLFCDWEPGNIVNFAFVNMGISPGQLPSPYFPHTKQFDHNEDLCIFVITIVTKYVVGVI